MKTTKEKHIERGGTAETFAARQKASRDGSAAAATRRVKSPQQELTDALNDAFGNSSRDMSEREALEVADSVAEGWRMRLSELDDDE